MAFAFMTQVLTEMNDDPINYQLGNGLFPNVDVLKEFHRIA